MSFFAIFLSLLLEQARPLGVNNPVYRAIRQWAQWIRRTVDAGQARYAWLAWGLAAVVPAVLSALAYWVLLRWHVLAAFALQVLVLYLTLGFRQFSHHFTAIREALEAGDESRAMALLAEWQGVDVHDLSREELLRHVIEFSVLSAHRHVFGVLLCFVVLAVLGLGPAGAVLYRMTELLPRVWRGAVSSGGSEHLQVAAKLAWHKLDHVPTRATAICFAVVGNFEEALSSWRQELATSPQARNESVLLAATAGAINVRLGGRVLKPQALEDEQDWVNPTGGREPQLAHLASVVGLVWRAVVLWMLLLALLMLAHFLG